MPNLSDFAGSDALPTRWKTVERLTVGSGTWTATFNGWIRVHSQGPGGAGRRAPSGLLGGPAGGAGGRPVKHYKVSVGDQFSWSVAQGGQAEGADGTGPTTWAGLVGNPGKGATAGLTGTSYSQGGGLGGTATGGDTNLPGAKGGDTPPAPASQNYYAFGACGGGAPHGELFQMVGGIPGNNALNVIETIYYNRPRVHRGGGEGGMMNGGQNTANSRAPGTGSRGGGGGGGGGWAAVNTGLVPTSHQFGIGGDGEILIEIDERVPRAMSPGFIGYRSGQYIAAMPYGALGTPGGPTINARRIVLAYFEFEDDVLIDFLSAQVNESPGYGAQAKFGIYSAETRKLIASTGLLTVQPYASSTIIGGVLDQPFIRKGAYFIGVISTGNPFSVLGYYKAIDAQANAGYTFLHEYKRAFPPFNLGNAASAYAPNVMGEARLNELGVLPVDLPEPENVIGDLPLYSFLVR